MDEDDNAPIAAPNDGMVPVLALPAPLRGATTEDVALGMEAFLDGYLEQESVLGPRAAVARTPEASIRSPPLEMPSDAAYRASMLRSPSAGVPPPMMYDPDVIRSPIEPNGKHMSTGLHRSEMF